MANVPSTSDLLKQLTEQLNNAKYKKKTDEEMLAEATNAFKSYYDQLRLAAQTQHDTAALQNQQQLVGLQEAYDRQREESQKAYNQAYSKADTQLLSRGMSRSSYGAQTLANITKEGAKAQQDISDQQTMAEGKINEQSALLANQLAKQLAQYDISEQDDIMKKLGEIEEREYNRGQQAAGNETSLTIQLYNLLKQQETAKKRSGGGSAKKEEATSAATQITGLDDLTKALSGSIQPAYSSVLTRQKTDAEKALDSNKAAATLANTSMSDAQKQAALSSAMSLYTYAPKQPAPAPKYNSQQAPYADEKTLLKALENAVANKKK